MAEQRFPNWSGKNAKVVFNLNDVQVPLNVKSWDVQRVGEWAEDDYCGERRTRSHFIIKYYTVSIEASEAELDLLEALLAEQANIDENAIPQEGWIGIQIRPNNGTSKALLGRGMSVGDWKFGAGGRTERNAVTLPLRFDDITGLPAMP
jgi:hypothetical protein